MSAYVIIERQWSDDLAIRYPDRDTAEHALEHSLFIDGLCEEDCLDAYVSAHLNDEEHITPPDESCLLAGEHQPGTDHRTQECPTYHQEDRA